MWLDAVTMKFGDGCLFAKLQELAGLHSVWIAASDVSGFEVMRKMG
jgi:hypothetical protein